MTPDDATPADELRRRTLQWTDPAVLLKARRASTGKEFFQRIANGDLPSPPFYEAVGIRLLEVGDGRSRFDYEPGEQHYNPMGIVHGGLAGSLIDTAAGVAVQSGLPEGPRPSTIRLSLDYMRPVTAETGRIFCDGTLAKSGRQIAHSDAVITDGEGRTIARGQGIFMMSPPTAWKEDPDTDARAAKREVRTRKVTWEDPKKILAAAAGRDGLALVQDMAARRLPPPPFAQMLDFDMTAAGPGTVTFSCTPTEMHYNPMGSVHGGLAFSLIDSAAGIAVATTLEPAHFFTTVNTTVEYFRAMTADTGPVDCVGTVVRRGRRVAISDAVLTNTAGTVLARGQSTCLVIARP